MSPLPSFGLIFSCVFWAPGFTYGGESLSYFGTQFVAMSYIWVFIFFCFLGSSARLFYVALMFFARFWSIHSLLWKIICPHFRVLGLDFHVFSKLQVSHMVERVWLTLEHNL